MSQKLSQATLYVDKYILRDQWWYTVLLPYCKFAVQCVNTKYDVSH